LLKNKSRLEELLRDTGHRVEQWLNLSEKAFNFACTARKTFAEGDAKTKKEILITIGSNLTLEGKKLSIEARKPFFLMENSGPGDEAGNDRIEPENILLPQRPKEAFTSSLPGGRGRREDVRTCDINNKKLVKSVYHFFKKLCMSPDFNLADWKGLSPGDSMTDVEKN
jgi:hypothetical protein